MEILNINASPNANILEAISNSGHDIISAIADIIDNSLEKSVNASKVSIFLEKSEVKGNILQKISICDNGCGMDVNTLSEALRLGSISNKSKKSDFGCFGMGLKSSSLSIGNCFTVITKVKNGDLLSVTYDKNEIIKSGKFDLQIKINSTSDAAIFKKYLETSESGTIVFITGIENGIRFADEPVAKKRVSSVFYRIFVALGIIFNKILSERKNLNLYVNNCKVFPIDPMMYEIKELEPKWLNENDNTFLYKPYDFSRTEYEVVANVYEVSTLLPEVNHRATERIVREAIIKRYNKDEYKKNHIAFQNVLDEIVENLKTNFANAGLYVYRNNRLVGKALDLALARKGADRNRNRMRIELFFSGDTENMIHSSYTKTVADNRELLSTRFADFLWARIMKYIQSASRNARVRALEARGKREDTAYLKKISVSVKNAIDKMNKDSLAGDTGVFGGKVNKGYSNKVMSIEDSLDIANKKMKELKLKTSVEFYDGGENGPVCDYMVDGSKEIIKINKDCSYITFLLYHFTDPVEIVSGAMAMYSACKTMFKFSEMYASKMALGEDYMYSMYQSLVTDYTQQLNSVARTTEIKD